jgi:UDP-N-acetylmuramoylalanine--D-glutamate ligase
MIELPHIAGKTVAVLGLGRTGRSAVRSLLASKAQVFAWDDHEEARTRIQDETGVAPTASAGWPWGEIDCLVLSPGIPLTHPAPHEVVAQAETEGVPVIGDMELFVRALGAKGARKAPVIAVTGTNGKSTTCALIHHILRQAGFNAQLGGNIGKPVLDLEPPGVRPAYVLEVSSYQLDQTPSLAPEVGVLLNIGPDHLDRHGGMEGYVAAKRRLFDGQTPADAAIVGLDDPYTADTCADLRLRQREGRGAAVTPITVGRTLGGGVFVSSGRLVDARVDPAIQVADMNNLSVLRGAHNAQNVAAAYAAATALGARPVEIAEALATFPGLAHRQEVVARQGNVTFVNDSKATNAEAAARALVSFDNIYWIAGGRPKEGGLAPLMNALGPVRRAYLIGEAAPVFEAALDGHVPTEVAGTLEVAVERAAAAALASGEEAVVLLSPACASFDQFTDFEARGEAFRSAARAVVKVQDQERALP